MPATGFGLPRAAKSARMMQLLKEYGVHLSQTEYVDLYRQKYGEPISLATVQNTLNKAKTDAVIILGIARSLRDIPREKLAVLVELSSKYGSETVLNAIKSCLIGEGALI